MKPSDRTSGTLVADLPADPATMFWRWVDDYLDDAIAHEELGSRPAQEQPGHAAEAWSMVWRMAADGSTVTAGLRDPRGREWRYERTAPADTLEVDVSDFRFIDQAE